MKKITSNNKQPASTPAWPPIAITLSDPAKDAVYAYRGRTGREIEDIINGVLEGELVAVIERLDESEQQGDDTADICAEHVEAAAVQRHTLARLSQLEKQPVGAVGEATSPTRAVTLEFTPGAYALLELLAAREGHDSVDAAIRSVLSGNLEDLCGMLSREDGEMDGLFGVKQEESEE